MAGQKMWDITKGALSINGIPVLGFKDGDHIVASYTEDRHTTHMSADNYGRHSKNPNTNGTVTIGLHLSSPSLTVIQQFVDTGEPLTINYVDYTAIGSYFHSDDCVIQKEPDFVRAKEVGDIDWVFTFTKGDIKHGTAKPA